MARITRLLIIVIALVMVLSANFWIGPVSIWICGLDIRKPLTVARMERARWDIKILEQAVKDYRLKNGFNPDTLDLLTSPDGSNPPFLKDKRRIIDPWGNPYIYEPNTLGLTNPPPPLIYTNGAPGANMRISNWD